MKEKDYHKQQELNDQKIFQVKQAMEDSDENRRRLYRIHGEIESNFAEANSALQELEYLNLSSSDWQNLMEIQQNQNRLRYDILDGLERSRKEELRNYDDLEERYAHLQRKRWQIEDELDKLKKEKNNSWLYD